MSDLPDAPRLDWDRWAVAVELDGDGVYERDLDESERQTLNDETDDHYTTDGWIVILPPVPFDLEAMMLASSTTSQLRDPEWSADTTNGEDGTWQPIPAYDDPGDDTDTTSIGDEWTTAWRTVDLAGVRGIRWGSSSSVASRADIEGIHLYGYPSEEPDGLALWAADADEPLPPNAFDFGNVLRGETPQAAFRVRNRGDDTAEGVKVKGETLTSRYDTIADAVEFSDDDGGTWVSELELGDLSGDTTTGELLVRVSLPDDVRLGFFAVRIVPERDGS